MRNSPSGPRGKPTSKQSGKPLAAPAMPPAKLGSERADKASTIGGRSKTGYTDYDLAGRSRLAVLYEGEEREMHFETPTEQVAFEIPDEWWQFAEMDAFSSKGAGFIHTDRSEMLRK